MTTLGKLIRLKRLQNSASGRILTVALDHAPSYGILNCLEDIQAITDKVAAGGPDAMMFMKGPAERCMEKYAGRIAFILKCSNLSPFHPEHDIWVHSVEDALRLGADAIAMAVTIGSHHQAEHLANLGALVREAEKVGLPVIAHAYPNGDLVPPAERYTLKQVAYASRAAMELGVDIVKTFYTGSAETFAEVVRVASPAIVVAAGGARLDSMEDVLQMARNVVTAGAGGITFGRNIWQCDDIVSILHDLKAVVHG